MKVFIGWSGELSAKVARLLHSWLRTVVQAIEPFMSEEDIAKGTAWGDSLRRELELSAVGILCLTEENVRTPWINFEAGALSKVVDRARVCPLRVGIPSSVIEGPLSLFQDTDASSRADMFRMLTTINEAQGSSALTADLLQESFKDRWPRFEQSLRQVLASHQELPSSKIDDAKPQDAALAATLDELLRNTRMLVERQIRRPRREYVQKGEFRYKIVPPIDPAKTLRDYRAYRIPMPEKCDVHTEDGELVARVGETVSKEYPVIWEEHAPLEEDVIHAILAAITSKKKSVSVAGVTYSW